MPRVFSLISYRYRARSRLKARRGACRAAIVRRTTGQSAGLAPVAARTPHLAKSITCLLKCQLEAAGAANSNRQATRDQRPQYDHETRHCREDARAAELSRALRPPALDDTPQCDAAVCGGDRQRRGPRPFAAAACKLFLRRTPADYQVRAVRSRTAAAPVEQKLGARRRAGLRQPASVVVVHVELFRKRRAAVIYRRCGNHNFTTPWPRSTSTPSPRRLLDGLAVRAQLSQLDRAVQHPASWSIARRL